MRGISRTSLRDRGTPPRDRCTPPYTAYTPFRNGLSGFRNRLSFYLYRLSGRRKSTVSPCLLRRLSRKRALFVSEKALYPAAFFVRLIRRRLSRKRALLVSEKALYSRVLFVENYREKEFFLLMKKHCIFAFSSRSSFFRSLNLYR